MILSQLLGNANKQTIYYHLEKRCGLKKEEIPYRIEDFAIAIEQTFSSFAKIIEVKIIERLHIAYRDFRYVPKKGELNLVDFVFDLKGYLEAQA